MENTAVMVTREFGSPIFIAPMKKLQIQITEKKEEAEKWHPEFDQTKLEFHRTITGYSKLTFEVL